MRCPYCNEPDSQVKDSRPSDDDLSIKRRRVCGVCGMKFTTFEHIQLRDIFVKKQSGKVEPFDVMKVERALRIACRKREIPDSQLSKMANAIQRRIETETTEDEVSSEFIGQMISEALLSVDPIAYVRFVSVYKKFTKISEFKKLIAKIPEEEEKLKSCDIPKDKMGLF
jgi:transcriptional repressor NrdR